MHTYTHPFRYIHTYTHAHTPWIANKEAAAKAEAHAHYTHTHRYIHTYIRTHTHTHTHTHKRTQTHTLDSVDKEAAPEERGGNSSDCHLLHLHFSCCCYRRHHQQLLHITYMQSVVLYTHASHVAHMDESYYTYTYIFMSRCLYVCVCVFYIYTYIFMSRYHVHERIKK